MPQPKIFWWGGGIRPKIFWEGVPDRPIIFPEGGYASARNILVGGRDPAENISGGGYASTKNILVGGRGPAKNISGGGYPIGRRFFGGVQSRLENCEKTVSTGQLSPAMAFRM
jgi:hypothetical protein